MENLVAPLRRQIITEIHHVDPVGADARINRERTGVAGEVEPVEIFGQRQLGNRELVLNRACVLLGDLGTEQVADNARRNSSVVKSSRCSLSTAMSNRTL